MVMRLADTGPVTQYHRTWQTLEARQASKQEHSLLCHGWGGSLCGRTPAGSQAACRGAGSQSNADLGSFWGSANPLNLCSGCDKTKRQNTMPARLRGVLHTVWPLQTLEHGPARWSAIAL